MMKSNIVFYLIFFSLIAWGKAFTQDNNLLDNFNGSFEEGLKFWRFFEVPNNIGSQVKIITNDVAHGSQAVKITFVPDDGSVADRGFDNWDANVPVVGGETYTAAVQTKATDGNALYLSMALGYFDLDRQVIDQISTRFQLTETYQTFTLAKAAPLSATSCWIAFRLTNNQGARQSGTFFLDDARLAGKSVTPKQLIPRVMPTLLPTDDVPIASLNITEAPYNAANDGSVDVTTAFQQAINFATQAGGAVIFVPAGVYRFDGSLLLREKVILRGDWQNPDQGGTREGTILMPCGGQGDAGGAPFIQLERGSGVKNMTIWYPNQSVSNISAYPWTLHCNPKTTNGPGDNTSIINVTLVNPYQAIKIGPAWNELHYLRNVYGAPLKTGIWLSQTTDIGRIMNVHFAPRYWSQSGFKNSPGEAELLFWLQHQAEGIVMGRSDWEYIYDVSLIGYQTGVRIFKYSDVGPNGVIYGLRTEKGQIGIKLEKVNSIGFAITGSTIRVSAGENPVCVQAGESFTSIVQFNSCTFGGQPGSAISFDEKSTGRLTFQNCRFEDWGYQKGKAAIETDAGALAVLDCEFEQDKLHFQLGKDVSNAQILDNAFPDSLQIVNESQGEVLVSHEDLHFPKLTALPHPFAAEPRPATDDLFLVQEFGAVADGETDDTDAFQAALNAAGQNGGGTVYVPAGWYKIAAHLSVPAGVEIRGIWDVPHHTISRGSVLLAWSGRGNADGDPFISLEPGAGIRGLTIWYPEQNSANIQAYPWAIQARGSNCWIKDVTIGNAYQAVDFATFPCANHYVSYLGGAPLKTGIRVNNNFGEGWVENVQFNPHYWLRSSGYPKVTEPDFQQVISFQQSQLEAFRFGDCHQEHILGNFVYAAEKGLYFSNEGGVCRADVFLHGTDAGSHGILMESGSGSELNFINSQLVVLGSNIKGLITTGAQFQAKASFFNTLSWGDRNGLTAKIEGDGQVTLQQLHTRNHRFNLNGGINRLHNIAVSREFNPQYQVNAAVQKVEIFGNYAPNGFKMINAAGDRVEADYNFKQGKMGIRLETGWETGQEQNYWNNTTYSLENINPFPGETAPVCQAQTSEHAHSGQVVLELSGQDGSATNSFVYFKIFNFQIPVFNATVLNYRLNPQDELGRNIHLDLLFTDGTRLTDFGPAAGDSLPLTSPRGKIGEWSAVNCEIGKYAGGKMIQTVLAGYDQAGQTGNFKALIDDLAISTASFLPEPWREIDIGNAQPAGYTIFDQNVFHVKGSGFGLRFTGDKFHFVYQPVNGDICITARLESQDDLAVGAFSGLMIRAADSSTANLFGVISSPHYGLYTKWRLSASPSVKSKGYPAISNVTPLWFRLTRQGDLFTGYVSRDGADWGLPLSEITVPMDSSVLVGLAVCSGIGSKYMNAIFSQVEITDEFETSISSATGALIPKKFQLYQNYPNPFNSATQIAYDLPATGLVKVVIYNLMGQKIRTLVNEIQPGGTYKLKWDGTTENAVPVASGLYYCHIQFRKQAILKKMIFLQ